MTRLKSAILNQVGKNLDITTDNFDWKVLLIRLCDRVKPILGTLEITTSEH